MSSNNIEKVKTSVVTGNVVFMKEKDKVILIALIHVKVKIHIGILQAINMVFGVISQDVIKML